MLLLVHRAEILRNAPVGTNGRKQYQTIATDVPCLALPLDRRAAIENNYDVDYEWDIYFDDGTDVNVSDKLVINGRSLIVNGRQPYEQIPIVGHLHVNAKTEDSNGQ